MTEPKPRYTLYSAATPNGFKASIMLEELGVPYELKAIDLGAGEQHAPGYVLRNPNGKIPTLIDWSADGFTIFESGAILLYLAEQSGRLLPTMPRERSEVMQWLFFQVGNLGPMQGQANVFVRYFDEQLPAVIQRYQNETRRLYEVLDRRLADRAFICGAISIADIATWPWVRGHKWPRVSLDGLNHLARWNEEMAARPACQRGIAVPPTKSSADLVAAAKGNLTR